MIDIAPSILSADWLRLGEQVRQAHAGGARRIHVDIMDGHFVPNLTMGPQVIDALHPLAEELGLMLHVHLMVAEPDRLLAQCAARGAHEISVHVEATSHLYRTVQEVWRLGAHAGVALNPGTPLVMLDDILASVDLVLVMTVEPGFGGQEFIPAGLERIKQLRETLARRGLDRVRIAVDGGVHADTIGGVMRAGADIAVAGTAVFNDYASVEANLAALRRAANGSD